MLRALHIQSGHSVLEIGTGTGWNAALLSEIVGTDDDLVTTVEIDERLADAARHRLETAGYGWVAVENGDATDGLPGWRRYDRIIATAGVGLGKLPYSWIERVQPGGLLLAPMRADLAPGPLITFRVDADGTAVGHADALLQVGFMELRGPRGHRVPGAGLSGLRCDDPAADQSRTDLAPWIPLLTDDHRWPLALALPGCRYEVWRATEERAGVAWLVDPLSDSWATVTPDAEGDRYLVRQHGPPAAVGRRRNRLPVVAGSRRAAAVRVGVDHHPGPADGRAAL